MPFLWQPSTLDPHNSKTLRPIDIGNGTIDYVGEILRCAKILYNSLHGGAPRLREICVRDFSRFLRLAFRPNRESDQYADLRQYVPFDGLVGRLIFLGVKPPKFGLQSQSHSLIESYE